MEDVGIFYVYLVYFRSFGIFYGHLVYFLAIWYIFGIFYKEKSGNPVAAIHKYWKPKPPKSAASIKKVDFLSCRYSSLRLSFCISYSYAFTYTYKYIIIKYIGICMPPFSNLLEGCSPARETFFKKNN
jgi:hypothetical protein